MKIDAVEAIPYRISMRKPLHFASGEVHHVDHVLLRIRTTDGITGVADLPPRPYTYGDTQQSIVANVESVFAPLLIGQDARDRSRIHAAMHRTVGNVVAKAGIDVALWDILGQAVGQPVFRLLGGFADSARCAHMVGFADPQAMVDEALGFRDRYGITTFKIKVGRRPLHLDIDAARALRASLGPEASLYLDANRGWTATEAMRVLGAVEDLDLLFFEEPCDAAEIMGRRRITAHSRMPIMADESAPTLADAARELTTGGASALSVKVARQGFTQAQKALALAEGLGVDAMIGNQIDSQIGSTASIHLAAGIEHAARHAAELSNYLDMTDGLAVEPLVIADGRIAAPETPGVGVAIDEDKLNRYRLDGKGA